MKIPDQPLRPYPTQDNKGKITLSSSSFIVKSPKSINLKSLLSKFEGSKYLPKQKSWQVPIEYFPHCIKNSFFPHNLFAFDPPAEEITAFAYAFVDKCREAQNRIIENPFDVSNLDIELGKPHVSFLLKDTLLVEGKTLSKQVLQSILSHKKYCERTSTSTFVTLPIHLVELLKWLKQQQLYFAVRNDASTLLKQATIIRKKLLVVNTPLKRNLTSEQHHSSMIIPFIDVNEDQSYYIKGATPSQLSKLLPKTALQSKKKDASYVTITHQEITTLLWKIFCQKFPIWLTQSSLNCLTKTISGNGEPFLPIECKQATWALNPEGYPLLVIPEHEKSEITIAPEIPVNRTRSLTLKYPATALELFEIDHVYFECAYQSTRKDGAFPHETENFQLYRQAVANQRASLIERNTFNTLTDYPLIIINKPLAKKLFPHQRVAVHWILSHHYTFVGDDMGLGKTLAVLTAIEELITQGEISRSLIVCPNSLTLNWAREVDQWMPNLNFKVLPKIPKLRRAVLEEYRSSSSPFSLALNYEAARVPEVNETIVSSFPKNRTLLCLDESQRVKNAMSKTFQALKPIATLAVRRILLSGTPTPKDISDIWSQINLLDHGERFGNDFYKWLESVAELGNEYSATAIKRFYPHKVEYTRLRVQEILLRRSKDKVLNLPEKTFIQRDIELSGTQKERFDQIRNELRIRLTSAKGRTFTREVTSILEQYLRAVQIASNPRLVDPSWQGVPAKFHELDMLLNEIVNEQDQKVLIWTNYLLNTTELACRYQAYGAAILSGQIQPTQRQETVKTFQDPASPIKVLIALPAVAGVGLTLTQAQTAIYLDKTWNAEHWLQSIDRIHRIGQTGTVTILSLHASKVDRLISANLTKKGKNQEALLGGGALSLIPSRDELIAAVSG
jgi:SWI/SNF-related matrix-associated actin-dependent regulator of chromatin subfamily A-like protein 1